ncbi:hypothetical protein Nmel_017683 [Mimus melanotis]
MSFCLATHREESSSHLVTASCQVGAGIPPCIFPLHPLRKSQSPPALGQWDGAPWKAPLHAATGTRLPRIPLQAASTSLSSREFLPGRAFHPQQPLPAVWDGHAQGTLGQQQDSSPALSVLVLPCPQAALNLLFQPHQTLTFG